MPAHDILNNLYTAASTKANLVPDPGEGGVIKLSSKSGGVCEVSSGTRYMPKGSPLGVVLFIRTAGAITLLDSDGDVVASYSGGIIGFISDGSGGWVDVGGGGSLPIATASQLSNLAAVPSGRTIQLLGYNTIGDGGGQLLNYYSSGRSGVTVDGGFYFNGPGTDDMFEAVDRSVANLRRFGCYADGTNASTNVTRATAAIATGKPVYAPSGAYATNAVLTISTNGQRLYGDGSTTIFHPSHNDGTFTIKLLSGVYNAIEGIKIDPSVVGLNVGGIQLVGATKFRIRGVDMHMESSVTTAALRLDAAFIGDIECYLRSAAIGLRCLNGGGNDVTFNLHVENCAQPMDLDGVSGARFHMMYEGTTAVTTTGTIDDCDGLSFDGVYLEQASVASEVPFITVGGTTKCYSLVFDGVKGANSLDEHPFIKLDNVDGVEFNGSLAKGAYRNLLEVTDNAKNVRLNVTNFGFTREPALQQAPAMQPVINYYPDPFFLQAYEAWPTSACSVSEETSVVLPWATRSIKLTPTEATGSHYIGKTISFANLPHLAQLKGKKVGMAMWSYVTDTAYFADGAVAAQVDTRITSNGTGAAESPSKSTTSTLPGKWCVIVNEHTIPSDATTLTLEYYMSRNGSGTPDDATDFAYLGGVMLWPGGVNNWHKIVNGHYFNYPWSNHSALRGEGDPEGAVAAPVGTMYLRTDGGAGTTLYIKESGTGNTGWDAK